MPKYIDADALVKSLNSVMKSLSEYGAHAAAGCLAGMTLYINDFEAADVEPVKREPCNRCLGGIKVMTTKAPNYCPYCGAKMEERNE